MIVRACMMMFLLAILWCGPAQARQVQVFQSQEEGKPAAALKEEALKNAFVQALLQEAQDILPAQAFETRKDAISAALAPKAGNYILSYSEAGREAVDKGVNLTLDIDVNRGALKKTLSEMGIYKADSSASAPLIIAVEGWRAPEGVTEVDRMFGTLDRYIESARLIEVTLLPSKVRARWEVRAFDRPGLEKRLQELLQQRGLTWSAG